MLALERLDVRLTPAVLIQVDYSRDTGFFANPAARAVVDQVARELGDGLTATATTGAPVLTLYADARPLVGRLAQAGPVPGGGVVTFDPDRPWHFGATTAGLDPGEFDFHSVAVHELGHVLGVGTFSRWSELTSGGFFHGPEAVRVYGGPVPLDPSGLHLRDGLLARGRPAAFDERASFGTRVALSPLDAAVLRDLGWATNFPPPPPLAPFVTPADPFPGYAGGVSVARGDVTGDGVLDTIFGTAVGSSHVKVFDGFTGVEVRSFLAFDGFAGGVFAGSGDTDGDGRAEVIVAAGPGGNAHVKVFDGRTEQLALSFFSHVGFNGPVAVAAGDLNGDGRVDVVAVAAGHVKAFDGPTGALVLSTLG